VIGRALGLGAAVVVVGLAVSGCQSSTHRDAEPTITTIAPGTNDGRPMMIDRNRQETFTPASASAVAPLTATGAFTAFAKKNGSNVTSPQVAATIQLGYLNVPKPAWATQHPNQVPKGLKFKTVDNKLVWAFNMKDCAPATGGSTQPSTPPRCQHWLFLDASNGHAVDETYLR
jgi:hypothetical protein